MNIDDVRRVTLSMRRCHHIFIFRLEEEEEEEEEEAMLSGSI